MNNPSDAEVERAAKAGYKKRVAHYRIKMTWGDLHRVQQDAELEIMRTALSTLSPPQADAGQVEAVARALAEGDDMAPWEKLTPSWRAKFSKHAQAAIAALRERGWGPSGLIMTARPSPPQAGAGQVEAIANNATDIPAILALRAAAPQPGPAFKVVPNGPACPTCGHKIVMRQSPPLTFEEDDDEAPQPGPITAEGNME